MASFAFLSEAVAFATCSSFCALSNFFLRSAVSSWISRSPFLTVLPSVASTEAILILALVDMAISLFGVILPSTSILWLITPPVAADAVTFAIVRESAALDRIVNKNIRIRNPASALTALTCRELFLFLSISKSISCFNFIVWYLLFFTSRSLIRLYSLTAEAAIPCSR